MRTPSLLLVVVLAGCASRATLPQTSTKAMPGPETGITFELPHELTAVHPALLRAWQGKQPDALRPFYTSGAEVITSARRFNGWTDIREHWLVPLLQGMNGFMTMPSSFTRANGDIVENGRYSMRLIVNGHVRDVRGIYSRRWQRQPAGSWQVVSSSMLDDSR